MNAVSKCTVCKESLVGKETIHYRGNYYCKYCYDEKVNRDNFQKKVCEIFSLKKPGPVIWTQRKRLLEKGFTDDNIIKCLDYLYNVLGKKKISESLIYINSGTVGAAINYFKTKEKFEREILKAPVKREETKKELRTPPKKIKEQEEIADLEEALIDDEW